MDKRILLIEDDRVLSRLVAQQLQSLGHEVTHAAGWREADDHLAHHEPHLVIADVKLPDGNSLERLPALVARQPVIVLTAFGSVRNAVAAMKAGFSVTATDYYDDALHVTRGNAARNLGREPEIRLVNWREWPEDLGRFDVVIAADVLYEKEYATLVAECLVKALKPDGVAIVADPGRLALPAFRDHLEAVGLELADTARVKYEDGVIKQEVQIMRLRLR